MSFTAMAVVWNHPKIETPHELALMMALADFANDETYECWPSQRAILEKCRMSRAGVQSTLKKLEEKQLIQVIPRTRDDGSQTSNKYILSTSFFAQGEGMPARKAGVARQKGRGSPPERHREPISEPINEPIIERAVNSNGTANKKRSCKKGTQLPAGFALTDRMLEWAAGKGISSPVAMSETEKFCDHARSKGRVCTDWEAAWRNWIRKSKEFGCDDGAEHLMLRPERMFAEGGA